MKYKMFCAWLMIVFFALVSFGGCGGSSNSNFAAPETVQESSVSMKEALSSEDVMQKVFDQIASDDLILIGLAEARICVLSVSEDKNIWAQDLSVLEGDGIPALYDPNVLRRHYDSEDVILLEEADIDFINKIRNDLGEVAEDPKIVGSSGYLEVYAIARILNGSSYYTFTYTVPTTEDIISSEGLSSQQDSSQAQSLENILSYDVPVSDDDEAVYTAVDFVADRWVTLFAWVSMFGIRRFFKEELDASAVFSAAASLSETTDKNNTTDEQNHTFDFSYHGLPAEGITYDDWNKSATAFTMSRKNQLTLQVYSAHSFQNGNDYYFVKADTSTTPNNYKNTSVSPTGRSFTQYMYGYTKYLGFEAWLEGSTADNVTLAASNPENLKGIPGYNGARYFATTSYNINGWAGVKQYQGPYALNGASYSNTQYWYTYGWDMVNNSGATHPSSAGWYADMYLPANLSGILRHRINPENKLSYTTDWVWEVKPDFWKSNQTPKLNVDFEVRDGATIASHTQNGVTYDRADKWFSNKQTNSLTLTPPPHVTASLKSRSLSAFSGSMFLYNLGAAIANKEQLKFAYTPDKSAATLTMRVLAEEDWNITYTTSDNRNWARFSETSGKATGANAKEITINIDENKGAIRLLQIDIQSGQEHAIVNILQNN